MQVVRSELVIPFEFSRVCVESEHRAAVEIVAGAFVTTVAGRGIAGGPINEIQLRIVRTGDPGRCAAGLPRVASPGFVARLAGAGNGIESPGTLAGVGVIGIDEAAHAIFAARDTNDN